MRTGANLKNPSTTVDAQLAPLQLHHEDRRPTMDGAAVKRAANIHPTSPGTPLSPVALGSDHPAVRAQVS